MWRRDARVLGTIGHHVKVNALSRLFSTQLQSSRTLQSLQALATSSLPARAGLIIPRWHNRIREPTGIFLAPFSTKSKPQSWWRGSNKPAESTNPQSLAFDQLRIPEETRVDAEQLPTRRVHILGLGSVGTLVAHSLRCLPNPPPITLMMHRPEMREQFLENNSIIRLVNWKTDVNDEQTGFDVDVRRMDKETGATYWDYHPYRKGQQAVNPLQPGEALESGENFIYTLIVTVKGPRTKTALLSVKHRINAQTTICLIQNGMGQVDQLNREVFTDPTTRPTYMLGIISHGAHMRGPFAVNHAGPGTVALGIYRDQQKYPLPPKSGDLDVSQLSEEERKRMYPTDEELYSNLSSRYLLRTLTRSPVLACASFPYLSLFQIQLEKLVQNCVVNPITALLNIPNGSMLGNTSISRALRLILAEVSMVIRGMPELEGVPGLRARFSLKRCESLCEDICTRTAANSSSMREDVRNLRPTEIDYINGYIVKRGEEQGIKCVLNYLVMKLVQGKTQASGGDEIKPYGTSSVEGDMTPTRGGPDGTVHLEDRGTQLKSKPY